MAAGSWPLHALHAGESDRLLNNGSTAGSHIVEKKDKKEKAVLSWLVIART